MCVECGALSPSVFLFVDSYSLVGQSVRWNSEKGTEQKKKKKKNRPRRQNKKQKQQKEEAVHSLRRVAEEKSE